MEMLLTFFALRGHVVAVVLVIVWILYRVIREPYLSRQVRIREGFISLFTFGLIGVSSWGVVALLKFLFPFARPFVVLGTHPIASVSAMASFPSGHAFVLGALAGAAWFFSKQLSFLLGAVAIITAIGRVYVGLHYPIDIVVGLILGIPLGVFIWKKIHHLDFLEKVIPKLK